MNTIIRISAISVLSLLSPFLTAQETKQEVNQLQEWVILKDQTAGYLDSGLTIKDSLPLFSYKEIVFGTLLKDTLKPLRSWIVEVKEGSEIIYFPFPELIQNIKFSENGNYKIGEEIVDILHPLAVNYKPDDLVLVDHNWNYHEEDYPKYLRKEVNNALIKMLESAASEKIHLRLVSAFRDVEKQRSLYLRAISRKGIHQIGTAKPAHSEHQLGTTVDLTSENREDLLSLSFDQTPEGKWLKENAHKFGFKQSYTKENAEIEGYMPEPWHFRYVGPNLKNHDY